MFNITAEQLNDIANQYNARPIVDKIGEVIIRRANNGYYDYLTTVTAPQKEIRSIKRFFEFRGFEVSYNHDGNDNNGNEIFSMYFRW